MFYIWLVIIVLGLIAELIKPMYLFGACFSLAGLIPFFMSFSSNNFTWYIIIQILIFVIISLILIFLFRKNVINWLKDYQKKLSIINSIGVLLKEDDCYYCLINNEKYIVSGNAEELDKYLGNKVIISKIERGKCKINPILDDKNREDTKDKDIKNDKK